MAWISLVPLMRYCRGIALKKVYIVSFLTGSVSFFLTFGWMGSFAGDIPYGNTILVLALTPVVAVIFATKIFLAELLARLMGKGRFFFYPAVWVLIDYFQTHGYMAFPWIFWGNTQYSFLPLIQLSSITGVFGITFLVILFNSSLSQLRIELPFSFGLLKAKENIPFVFSCLALLIIICAGSFRLMMHPESKNGNYTVAQIQTCISPWEDWFEHRYSYMRDLVSLTLEASKKAALDLVVWNESTSLETLSYSYRHRSMNSFEYTLFGLAKHIKVPLLTGEIGQYETSDSLIYTNGAIVVNADGTLQNSYSKIHLAPIGETFPYGKIFPKLHRWLESMGASSFTPGSRPVVFSTPKGSFGTLICYESLFPALNRSYKRLGVDYLVNITNDGWSYSYSGHMQHFAGSPFRAVENGLYYVRCGNTGLTAVIDPYGRVVSRIPLFKKAYLIESIDFSQNRNTIYSRIGDLFVWLIGLLLALCLFLISRNLLQAKAKRVHCDQKDTMTM